MSRSVIINMASGKLDLHDPETREFLERLATSELRGVAKLGLKVWQEILGVRGMDGWQARAVLCILGQMFQQGAEGGKPPIMNVSARKLAEERSSGRIHKDQEWYGYFLSVFHQEQAKFLRAQLGLEGKEVFRKRLLKAIHEVPNVQGHDYSTRWKSFQYYGTADAVLFDADVKAICSTLNKREAQGESAKHDGGLPTPTQIKEVVSEVVRAFPKLAPHFEDWFSIICYVFDLDFEGLPNPDSNESSKSTGIDEETNLGKQRKQPTDQAGKIGDWSNQIADGELARELILKAIAEVDGNQPFPEGDHATLFLEYWIFQASRGSFRVTLLDYSQRIGIPYNTLDSRRKRLEQTLAKHCLGAVDPDEFMAAIAGFCDEFLGIHREIFRK